ncbi:MAG: sialate O-acetylesterase [Ruminococcaceae bacterium]|nr:sialate O-acetylesterase [Oscillospiraceae bacterium]
MIHSFLLIGQSNAAGRGFLNEAESLDNLGGAFV